MSNTNPTWLLPHHCILPVWTQLNIMYLMCQTHQLPPTSSFRALLQQEQHEESAVQPLQRNGPMACAKPWISFDSYTALLLIKLYKGKFLLPGGQQKLYQMQKTRRNTLHIFLNFKMSGYSNFSTFMSLLIFAVRLKKSILLTKWFQRLC